MLRVVSLSNSGPFGHRDAPRRQPYLDIEEYNTLVAKNASKAAEGLCAWTKAMCSYQAASKIVKPKLEALKLAEAKLAEAQKELDKAEAKLQGVMDVLNKLQKQFEDQMAVKAEIEAGQYLGVLWCFHFVHGTRISHTMPGVVFFPILRCFPRRREEDARQDAAGHGSHWGVGR